MQEVLQNTSEVLLNSNPILREVALKLSSANVANLLERAAAHDELAMWMKFIPVAYVAVIAALKLCGVMRGETTKKGMDMTHLLSFMVVSMVCVCWTAGAGLALYFEWFGVHDQYTVLAKDMFYARSDFVEKHLLIPMGAYQVYNTAMCFMYNEQFDTTMIVHHTVVVVLQLIGFSPFLHAEAFFFIGMAEITNIPLTWMDICKKRPEWRKRWPTAHTLCQLVFALSFIIIRMILWPIRAIPVWYNLGNLMLSGACRSKAVAVGFIIISSILTVMQMVWGKKIVRIFIAGCKEALEGGKEKKA